ncbi:MAG: hypothetical protein JOZ24_01095 [Candidatus Eremiobacteraeota bacterium]|nr:hypothetical protein [Candidatus Eremiobacteraeota bacterium]
MIRGIRTIALAATLALAACGGGGNTTNTVPTPAQLVGGTPTGGALRIAGVGDSLTAGVQSGALLGVDLPVLGTNAQLGQIGPVQRTQEHGFFALLWQQANGTDINALSNPASSPLPLIGPSALGGLLAPTTAGFPQQVAAFCSGAQTAANAFSTALSLRLNPASVPYDVAVPGQTAHEALYMVGAINDCSITAANAPGAIVNLNALVNSESQSFWPILASFGQGVTQVQAALALRPQVATVWLGHNELLKFAFSNGTTPVVPTPQSVHDDIKAIVQQLQGAGARVVVGNLFDVTGAAVFIPQPAYASFIAAGIQRLNPAIPPAAAQAAGTTYANAESAQIGLGPGGLFTINAYFKTLQAAAVQGAPPTLTASDVVFDPVVTQLRSLQVAYNAAIAQAVSETGAALADVATVFKTVQTNGGYPINPPKCCSLVYGGGFFSLDGLHPSNTGYAVVAKTFIDSLNAAYKLNIAPIDPLIPSIYAADPYAPH